MWELFELGRSTHFGHEIMLHTHCLVRKLPDSFEKCLKQSPAPVPASTQLAKDQHEAYVQALNTLVPNVISIEPDENHPDCCFIEDTAIVVGDTVVICRMGALERRGEEIQVRSEFQRLGVKNLFEIETPGMLDGGDVLFTGRDLIVGISKRTNRDAVDQLEKIFEGKVPVYGIPVIEGLHLKSIISAFDSQTLIVGASRAGAYIAEDLQRHPGLKERYSLIFVPDPIASNVLRVGSSLFVQDGFPASESILQSLCDKHQVSMKKLNMSELIKADGAMTCCSILLTANAQ